MNSIKIEPKPGFDWGRVAWGAPDSRVRPFCSYCHGALDDESVPLILSRSDGSAAQFCDVCMQRWWGSTLEEPL
jgi:hypothetical protein